MNDVDQQNVMTSPRTYDQWQSMLTRSGALPYEALCDGRVDGSCAMLVMRLIAEFCERRLNRYTKSLMMQIEDSKDADSLVLMCARYSSSCNTLLFFTRVQGLPDVQSSDLSRQIRSYVLRVLRSVVQGMAPPNEDVEYSVRRLERRWADE